MLTTSMKRPTRQLFFQLNQNAVNAALKRASKLANTGSSVVAESFSAHMTISLQTDSAATTSNSNEVTKLENRTGTDEQVPQTAVSNSGDSLTAVESLSTQEINNNAKIPLEKTQAIQAKIAKLQNQIASIFKSKWKSKLKFEFNPEIKQKKIEVLKKIVNGAILTKEDLDAIAYVDFLGKSEELHLLEKLDLLKTTSYGNPREKYFGQWANGKKNGYGIEYCYRNDGKIIKKYEGPFIEGEKSGNGIEYCYCRYNNGIYCDYYYNDKRVILEKYEGPFVKGQKCGRGIAYYFVVTNSTKGGYYTKYEGEFANDQKSGHGIITSEHKYYRYDRHSDHVPYSGQFAHNLRNGWGMQHEIVVGACNMK